MRRCARVFVYDLHTAKGSTLGSHEHAEQRHKDYTAFGSNIHRSDLFYTSKALVKIQIGQKRGNPLPCNGGGWVNIDHILSREDAFPQDRCRSNDKFQITAERVRSEDRRARKPRLQTHGWTMDSSRAWRMVATIVHSSIVGTFGFWFPAELCNMLFPNMSDRLGGACHVTKPSALEGIILRGIVPGSAKVGGTLRSICTLGQREHLDQDCNARCQRGR